MGEARVANTVRRAVDLLWEWRVANRRRGSRHYRHARWHVHADRYCNLRWRKPDHPSDPDSELGRNPGWTLAYVYLEGGTFLNAEIIRQGFGQAYTRFPFRYLEEFRSYEREAREAGKGLWGVT